MVAVLIVYCVVWVLVEVELKYSFEDPSIGIIDSMYSSIVRIRTIFKAGFISILILLILSILRQIRGNKWLIL